MVTLPIDGSAACRDDLPRAPFPTKRATFRVSSRPAGPVRQGEDPMAVPKVLRPYLCVVEQPKLRK